MGCMPRPCWQLPACSCMSQLAHAAARLDAQEFGNGTSTESKGESFAAALQGGAQGSAGDAQETGKLETVVRISGTNSMNTGGAAAGAADTESRTANGTNGETPEASAAASTLDASIEKKVDRIIDQHDNEFVLSRPGSDVAVLTLDPQVRYALLHLCVTLLHD